MARTDKIAVPVQVVGFQPKADRSWKLAFETRELSGEEVALLADNFQGEGWLVFKPNAEVTVEDIPEGEAEAGVKSPAQRLRAKIYIMWRQKGKHGDFETYYRTSIERLIEHIDAKLEDPV